MNFIIQDLLDFAQIKADRFRQNIKSFNIRDCVEKVMLMLQQKAIEKDIDFMVEFETFEDCHLGGDNSPLIYSDEHRIMQVLLILQ
jgi:signal transduction histidine kinase